MSERKQVAYLPLARRVLAALIVLAVPVWLSLSATRLLVSEAYVQFEYGKADFPADSYGFTQADRLAYAPYAIAYLTNDSDISFLGDLELPDGVPMYNARELGHMADVKAVMQFAFAFHGLLSIGLLVAGIWLYVTTRMSLLRALKQGAIFTLALIVSLVVIAALSWDTFFETFHSLFFAQGTWRFLYSDTLIRLFPERFWFDAAVTIGVLVVVGAVLLFVLATLAERLPGKRNV